MTIALTLAEIENRARALNLTGPQLCGRAGHSPHTWHAWKRGTVTPRLDTLETVANWLFNYERQQLQRLAELHHTSELQRILGPRHAAE